jgi:peptidoglycan/LPS O-acetylase OafA/YrhL
MCLACNVETKEKRREPMTPMRARISTLDGWRGVAILLVLAEHAGQYGRFKDQLWTHLGSLGVDIFFVLSGYIITVRLIQEREESSTISLANFYLRRAFRILPLVAVYLATLCMLSRMINAVDFRWSETAGALFFFRNYQYVAHPRGIYTAHFWSLSIEEHFYLLWPALLLLCGNKRAVWLAVAGAAACAMWRIYDYTHPMGPISRMIPSAADGLRVLRTDVRLDGLLVGCALALVLSRQSARSFIFHNFPKETPLLAGTVLLLHLQWSNGFPSLTTYVLVACMLASTLIVEEGLVFQWLNFRPLIWIGVISYSLYIWQQIFLLHPAGTLLPFGALSRFPANLLCAFFAATCSFYLLERPAIAIGKRILSRKRELPSPLLDDGVLMATIKVRHDASGSPLAQPGNSEV